MHNGDRWKPAARKHVAVSGTEFHHCFAGNLPLAKLRERLCQIHSLLKSGSLPETSRPKAGRYAMDSCCPSARIQRCFLSWEQPTVATARATSLYPTCKGLLPC